MNEHSAQLIVILGDQLSMSNPALAGADKSRDLVLMVEAIEESTYVWSHKARSAIFLSAMRHFAAELSEAGFKVEYWPLGGHPYPSLGVAWRYALTQFKPRRVIASEAGDWRVEQTLIKVCQQAQVPMQLAEDSHFLISRADFVRWAGADDSPSRSKSLRMEQFYRFMRKRTGILMQADGAPEGDVWNLDAQNRGSFGKQGPEAIAVPPRFTPDVITQGVFKDIGRHLPDHPGSLEHFVWPVTRSQALQALHSFMSERLPQFGRYQDAMWIGEPFLYHSLLSAALNLKLLDPREVIAAAIREYREARADLASTEGFVRQILGWREFMRGVYWLDMPQMRGANHFGCVTSLPSWYWSGATQMNCMRKTIDQTLAYGYAHHIQRLMVTGNFALLAGILPQAVCDWYLAVYVDAVEWVELPNTAGMALYANGGRFTTKPYAASGAYIKRMSNYCGGCRYKPEVKTGSQACPITTFYWDFLLRHEAELSRNPRAMLMMKNLARLDEPARKAIRAQATKNLLQIESL